MRAKSMALTGYLRLPLPEFLYLASIRRTVHPNTRKASSGRRGRKNHLSPRVHLLYFFRTNSTPKPYKHVHKTNQKQKEQLFTPYARYRCGMVNAPKGASYQCGLRIDRQLNANLYLQMEGLPPTPKLFDELMKGWRGFTLTGEEADEGSDELKRSPKLLNPKSYVSLSKTT